MLDQEYGRRRPGEGEIDGSANSDPNRRALVNEPIENGDGHSTGSYDKNGDYVFDDDDQLVLSGNFIIKNLDMNKVTVIMQEIGQQPVLSFGNSSSDSSMAEYVTTNNKYKSLAFMLCCDDTERENGNPEKAKKMANSCTENGWTAISMKNDWKTIYGEGVTRK